jgi:hypothetical protein
MSNNVTDLSELRAALSLLKTGGLKGGGGGGTSDDMEARVKRLEDDSKEMRADLKAIRVDLAEIKGKVSNMPATWQMIAINAGMIGLVIAAGGGMLALLKFLAPVS